MPLIEFARSHAVKGALGFNDGVIPNVQTCMIIIIILDFEDRGSPEELRHGFFG